MDAYVLDTTAHVYSHVKQSAPVPASLFLMCLALISRSSLFSVHALGSLTELRAQLEVAESLASPHFRWAAAAICSASAEARIACWA